MRQPDLNPSSIQLHSKTLAESGIAQAGAQLQSVQIQGTEAKGQGVFATRSLAEGEIAIIGRPVARLSERTWKSLQIDVDTHVLMDAPFEYVNHSCNPNCGVQPNQHDGYNLVAMRAIDAEEEITFDYCMTEWICVGFRDCCCGSDRCRRFIEGAKHLPIEILVAYAGYTAPYYRTLLAGPMANGTLADQPYMLRRSP